MSDSTRQDFLAEDFLDEVLKGCFKNKNFFLTIRGFLKDNYIPDEAYRKVWKEIKNQYSLNNDVPTMGTMALLFRKERSCLDVIGRAKRIVIPDLDKILENFEQYIKQNKFLEIYDKMADIYNQESKQKAFNYFLKEADEFSKFSLRGAISDKVFGHFNRRNLDRISNLDYLKDNVVPYGIDELDYITNGGKQLGETTLFLGESGAGKSYLLIHEGVSAARLGNPVIHFQAEGTRKQVLDRYDSAWTGVLYRDMKYGRIDNDVIHKIKRIIESLKSDIYVYTREKFGAWTMVDVRNKIIEHIKVHGEVKTVIMDYLELFEPGDGIKYSPGDERFRQQKIGRMMKDLAVEFNIDLTTATQSSSIPPEQLKDPNFVITRYNLSEDKGKIRPFDNFITINRTKDERGQRTCRLHADKFREHDSDITIKIAQNLARARFYDRQRTFSESFINEELIEELRIVNEQD